MLETPCLIIDPQKMERNIRYMTEVVHKCGVNLRPHIKTHKIPSIAKKQLDGGAVGITAAKVSEAEVMARYGIRDIFIAFPVIGDAKIERVLKLSQSTRLTVGVDSMQGAKRMAEMATAAQRMLNVRLEVDTGLKRTGVPYEKAVDLAEAIHSLPSLQLTGIYTYRGALLREEPTRDLESAGLEEGEMAVTLANRIRERGIPLQDVSVGSTPTAAYAAKVKGVTEVRPGTYVFYDRMQANLGVCSLDDCAAAVLVTVVSRPTEDWIVIDGGSKTFATDIQPNTPPLHLTGFGHVVGHPDIVFERMTEEHGMLKVTKDHPFQVGDRIRIIPNHICSTVNLHNRVTLESGSGEKVEWEVSARGHLT